MYDKSINTTDREDLSSTTPKKNYYLLGCVFWLGLCVLFDLLITWLYTFIVISDTEEVISNSLNLFVRYMKDHSVFTLTYIVLSLLYLIGIAGLYRVHKQFWLKVMQVKRSFGLKEELVLYDHVLLLLPDIATAYDEVRGFGLHVYSWFISLNDLRKR